MHSKEPNAWLVSIAAFGREAIGNIEFDRVPLPEPFQDEQPVVDFDIGYVVEADGLSSWMPVFP